MVLLFLAASFLCTASPEPLKVAAPSLTVVNIDPKLAEFYTGHLSQQLSFQGVRTITSTEIAAVLGLERQKQLLGCNDDSCKAELSSALGVDGILVGTVSKVGKTFQIDARILAPGSGSTLATASSSSEDSDRFVGIFPIVAEQLALQFSKRLGKTLQRDASVEVAYGPSKVKKFSWVPLVVGLVTIPTGAVLLGMARGNYGRLTDPKGAPIPASDYPGIASTGSTQQTAGWVLVGVGIAAMVGAGSMFLFGGNEVVRAGVSMTPQGGNVMFAGEF